MVLKSIFRRCQHQSLASTRLILNGKMSLSFSRYLELARLSTQAGPENTVERAPTQFSSDLFDGEGSDTVEYSHFDL